MSNTPQIINDSVQFFRNKIEQATNINDLLHYACLSENVELVEYLLRDQSIDVNFKKIFMKFLYHSKILDF